MDAGRRRPAFCPRRADREEQGMGFSIEGWMREYIAAVQERFGRRVRFIGLQGSFARGEAGPGSDIDAVLILDRVEAADLTAYSGLLDRLLPDFPHWLPVSPNRRCTVSPFASSVRLSRSSRPPLHRAALPV